MRDNFYPLVSVPWIATAKLCCKRFAGLSRIVLAALLGSENDARFARNLNKTIVRYANRPRGRTLPRQNSPDVTEPDVNGRVEILHEDEALIVPNKPVADARGRAVLSQHAPAHPKRGLPSAETASGAPAGRKHDGVVLVTRTRYQESCSHNLKGQIKKLYLVRVK